jgi:benzoylformate decarboxylase
MPLTIDVMLAQMAAGGIRAIYGNPGTFEQALLDRLHLQPGLRYVLCLHESVAVGAAMGHARVSKQLVAVQLHGSVGLGNAMGLLLEAQQAKVPLLVYVGENAQHDEAYQGFLAYDVAAMARPVCKEVVRVTVPAQLPRQLRRAMQIAHTPPYGPVLFTVPMDVLEGECPGAACEVTPPLVAGRSTDGVMAEIARLLEEAERPFILVGDAVAWAGAQTLVGEIARRCGAPIYGSGWTMGNAVYDDPLFQEPLSHAFGQANAQLLREADVVLNVGAPLAWEVIPSRESYLRPGAKLIHLDSDPAEIGRNFPPTVGLCGNVRELLEQLLSVLGAAPAGHARAEECRRWEERKLEQRRSREAQWSKRAREEVNHPLPMFRALAAHLTSADLIYEEAMTAQIFLRHTFPLADPTLYYPALSRALGAGLPGAIGAKLARPDCRVVALSSDGAALYVPQALWTASHCGLDILFIIANNQSYRVLKLNLDEYRRRLGVPAGENPHPFMDLTDPPIDFLALAATFGLPARRARTPEEVDLAMRELEKIRGPRLLDLMISGSLAY